MNALVKVLATAFGAGYSPIGPGTCGTALTVPLVWALSSRSWWAWALITAAITALAIAVAHRADRIWSSQDNQRIVIDEVAGYCITMIPVERGWWAPLAAGFVVFRLLDIFKPWPIRWFDKNLSGGLGVVADDAVAGVIGAALMAALAYFGAFDALAGI